MIHIARGNCRFLTRTDLGSNLLLVAIAVVSGSCASTYRSNPDFPAAPADPGAVCYVLGDFGFPSRGLRDVVGAVAREVGRDEDAGRSDGPPIILELGDNLYVSGLPRPGVADSAELEQLRAIAIPFLGCRYRNARVPVVLLPGNHDYDGDALNAERKFGDITRWYFLDELGIAALSVWRMVPGELRAGDTTPAALYRRLYGTPTGLVEFMAPAPVGGTGSHLVIVALDSQLLIDLYRECRTSFADQLLTRLREELRAIPDRAWRIVAMHHPIATYGEHRPISVGRLCLGPGWPQFPEAWQVLAAIPPVGSLITLGRWAASHPQDFHSTPQRRYREALRKLCHEEKVDVVLSGHDHNLQLLELSHPNGDASLLQVISGSASNVDSVTRGHETLAYHAGHGFVRLVATGRRLTVDLHDRTGELLYRHSLIRNEVGVELRPVP